MTATMAKRATRCAGDHCPACSVSRASLAQHKYEDLHLTERSGPSAVTPCCLSRAGCIVGHASKRAGRALCHASQRSHIDVLTCRVCSAAKRRRRARPSAAPARCGGAPSACLTGTASAWRRWRRSKAGPVRVAAAPATAATAAKRAPMPPDQRRHRDIPVIARTLRVCNEMT